MHEGNRLWPFLAVSPAESAATIEGILTFGLLWLDWTRNHAERRAVEGLRLFVPAGTSRLLCERVLALSPAARTEIFEFAELEGRIRKMDPADGGNIESGLTFRRDIESTLAAAQPSTALVRSLAPNLAGSTELLAEIETRDSAGSERSRILFSWTGVCALVSGRCSVRFGRFARKAQQVNRTSAQAIDPAA